MGFMDHIKKATDKVQDLAKTGGTWTDAMERKAQLMATATANVKIAAQPYLDADGIKEIKTQALKDAREKVKGDKS